MMDGKPIPKAAIVCPNSLTVIGMRQILQAVMPGLEVVGFDSADSLADADLSSFFHFFVDMGELLANRQFFAGIMHRTIVLAPTPEHVAQMQGFHCICVNVPEKQLVRSLLLLMREGHKRMGVVGGMQKPKSVLSVREIEVLALVVQGYINKEIADMLHISMATVITHRRNINEKLGMRSVSQLTIYAVMNGYVSVHKI